MRTAGYAVQQALTPEAAGTVKQAVVLAKRRGHAQVTPLHVATTMLAATTGLLRTACLRSHSHPLRCNALELCFNVALNRLPTSSASPILGHHSSHFPAISNALVAAFKRAQAHQRRGSIENHHQQPILAVKVELAHLIISILDDPSVSRVMREAGFSSTQVKRNVEKGVSSKSKPSSPSRSPSPSPSPSTGDQTGGDGDINSVINSLTSKKWKSIVIVGECVSDIETVVRGVINRVKKGETPEDLREVEVISIPSYSFCNIHREEVEKKMTELTSSMLGKGVVLYLGDLGWILDHRVTCGIYSPVEHMIMELGRLIHGIGEINGRLWIMGTATFQTYRRCTTGHNSLETLWSLHPVTIHKDSLDLSLISHSREEVEARTKNDDNGSSRLMLTCGEERLNDYSAKSKKIEASKNSTCNSETTWSNLPPWLRNERRGLSTDDQNCASFSSPSEPHNPNLQSTHFPMLKIQPLDQCEQNFNEFTAESLNILCNELEKKVPHQKEIIPEIAATILQCRSGKSRRRERKQDTWLYFRGRGAQAKQEIARELANIFFGLYSNSVSVNCREEYSIQRFAQEVNENPHRVFFVQDLECADFCAKSGLKLAIERGSIGINGEEVSLCDAIIILSSESGSSIKQKCDESMEERGCVSLDLNISFYDRDSSTCVVDELIDDDDDDIVGLLEKVDRCIVFRDQEM